MKTNGKRVLLRLDFNVPFQNGIITDDFRIRAALPTIQKLLKSKTQVFILSHLEEDGKIPHLDLVHKRLEQLLKKKVLFLRGGMSMSRPIKEQIVLFDNVRLNTGEKTNNALFVKKLASWGDCFINDAFAVLHREHASVVGIPKILPSKLGPLVKKEISELSRVFHPLHPFLFVLGGAKFSTKEPLISAFLKSADAVAVGGVLANTFLKDRGYVVGKSHTDSEKIPHRILWHEKILLPHDVIVLRNKKKKTVLVEEVENHDIIYDAGPKTVKDLAGLAYGAKFILWNGTLGLCEKGFCDGTKKFAQAVGASRAYSIVGGGDTVAAIRQLKLEKNFDFISTGGGAMLEFLAKGTLPGIEAIEKTARA